MVLNSSFVPKGTFANVWRLFWVVRAWEGDASGIWWVEARDTAKHPIPSYIQWVGQLPTTKTAKKQNKLTPQKTAEVEKLLQSINPSYFWYISK